ncbi:hypothetical protein E1295_42580 [Nonomuraea mesophila]|uniref:Uncharacterized protein n=1 Tax=Nonomuraea mesophila TaxID=2530382 RepID=A0A4R5E9A8_9ACTN|nr:hypothetical protein E1295_42580 [Nonomuraea mesophila]
MTGEKSVCFCPKFGKGPPSRGAEPPKADNRVHGETR